MTWKEPEKWEGMKQGIDCSFCKDMHLDENEFSYLVAELKQSFVRLPKNQKWRGYTIVALKRHANELFELGADELAEYWQDVAQVAKAVNEVFTPVKLNYAVYGNLCPHVHCHIFPQQFENDPHAPITIKGSEAVLLSEQEYQETLSQIRRKL